MTHTIRLPTILRVHAGGEATVSARGGTVGEAFADLGKRYPGLVRQLLDPDGSVPVFVNVFLNDEDIRYLQGLNTPISAPSEIILLPSVAGG
ncbi:MAG: MoaD/ThiS family protein [Actinomycetia bacterium]|nr:MoaD/ThiS family protein [Actinomycetes bacterium]MCQ3804527.1 MoaD/ThiS family protein [Acidimicrobiia bacterium]MCY4650925.1 MoaD/ThiS family protein [bacterium]